MNRATNEQGCGAIIIALVAALLAVWTVLVPSKVRAADMVRAVVTLENFDREQEIADLFAAIVNEDYRVVRISLRSPIVIIEVSQRALGVIERLPYVVGVSVEESPQPPEPLDPSFRVSIRSGADFDAAVEAVRAILKPMRHVILELDAARRFMIVSMPEQQIGLLTTIGAVEGVVMIGGQGPGIVGDGITPLPDGETPEPPPSIIDDPQPIKDSLRSGKMQRMIVQYSGSDRRAEERRILRALQGVPHKVAKRFEVTPAIVIDVDRRGLERLRRLRGVTVTPDSAVPPT